MSFLRKFIGMLKEVGNAEELGYQIVPHNDKPYLVKRIAHMSVDPLEADIFKRQSLEPFCSSDVKFIRYEQSVLCCIRMSDEDAKLVGCIAEEKVFISLAAGHPVQVNTILHEWLYRNWFTFKSGDRIGAPTN